MNLLSISSEVFEGITNFVINYAYLILSPIVNLLYSMVSTIEPFLNFINNCFEIIQPYVTYAMDMSFITPATWQFIILCIILRLSYGLIIWSVKLIVSWYHYLVP